jgi:hypothetical protein
MPFHDILKNNLLGCPHDQIRNHSETPDDRELLNVFFPPTNKLKDDQRYLCEQKHAAHSLEDEIQCLDHPQNKVYY